MFEDVDRRQFCQSLHGLRKPRSSGRNGASKAKRWEVPSAMRH